MTTNDIVTLVLGLIGCSILLWVVIKTGKDNLSEDLK